MQKALLFINLALFASACCFAQADTVTEVNGFVEEKALDCENEQYIKVGNEPFTAYDGFRIASIRLEQIDVFDTSDPREDTRIYRFMNRIHTNTRPGVIRGQLLFQVGDPVITDRLAESERILRAKPYLSNARIRVDQVCGRDVALLVTTQDIWTTEPQITLGLEGGNTKQGFSVFEGNVAGTGNAFSMGYRKDENREALLYDFYSPHLMNTHLTARLKYADNSDGEEKNLALLYPFFSLQSPWSAGMQNMDITKEEVIRFQGQDINVYRHEQEFHEIFGGVAVYRHADASHRLLTGLTQQKHAYRQIDLTQAGIPDDFDIVYPWLEYQYLQNRYAEYVNLNYLHQVEDVPTGKNLRLRLGYGGNAFGNDHDVFTIETEYSDWLQMSENKLLQMQVEIEGRTFTQDLSRDELIWSGQLDYYHLIGARHRWYAAVRYDRGYDLQQHNEMVSDDLFSLRGYPIGYQRGDRRYLMTLEKRHISNLHLFNLIRLGTAVYIDAGRVWGAGYSDSSHLSNVGVGLRLSSSKARLGNVIHVDLAFPLADKDRVDEFQWVIKSSNRF